MRRDKPKDAYDVVWLIAGLGPELAASRVLESPLVVSEHGDAVRAQLGRLVEQFADRDGVGARSYADFLTSGDADSDRRFAVGAVAEFGRYLGGSDS